MTELHEYIQLNNTKKLYLDSYRFFILYQSYMLSHIDVGDKCCRKFILLTSLRI